ncbi:MAG: GntR family transcriptional regulator [Planctomycetota bacterium]|nr:GntR family transcriptional regulator [Planctomycetota bacterium]
MVTNLLRGRYRNICEDLRRQIGVGRLAVGSRLPSESVLAKRYRVCRMTVRHALQILESDGLLRVAPAKRREVVRAEPLAGQAGKRVPRATARALCLVGGNCTDFGHPYIAGIHEGIGQVLQAAHVEWDMRLARNGSDDDAKLFAGDYAGVLTLGIYRPELLSIAKRRPYPVVFLNCRPLDGSDAVCTDNYAGGHQAGVKILGLGHRRLGYFTRQVDDMAFQERQEGFLRAAADAGLSRGDVLVIQCPEWTALDPDGTVRLLESLRARSASNALPTAFFACSDYHACLLVDLFHAMGVRVPEDVSVVGFDHHVPFPRVGRPALATFEQPGVAIGRRGAEKLLQRLENPAAACSVELVAPQWIEGQTLSAPRA